MKSKLKSKIKVERKKIRIPLPKQRGKIKESEKVYRRNKMKNMPEE